MTNAYGDRARTAAGVPRELRVSSSSTTVGGTLSDQLAPLLRRAGVRTIRVSTEGRRKTRIASWLLFDRYAILPHGSDVGALRAILADENVVDVQFAESLGDLVAKNADMLDPGVAERVGRRISVVDKFVAAGLFAAAGVRTPGWSRCPMPRRPRWRSGSGSRRW